jgi:uroporphyrinogen decarboxylase
VREDVLAWARGERTGKLVTKETLNHRELIELVSGLDVYEHTAEAYRRAYQALGIDIINRVPLENAPAPTPAGETRPHPTRPYHYAPLGVYDTVMRHTYPCSTPEEVWALDVEALSYDELLTPVPHPCTAEDIRAREAAIGEVGLYYPMLYTTLFMWAVEVLGWNTFMITAALEPDRFHAHFLVPCAAKSARIVTEMARASDSLFLYVHDDLADARGPVFRPSWYEQYVFPHYPAIWAEAKRLGKKVIYVADGNMTAFLPQLVEAGVDGLMFETPAAPLEAVIEYFGQEGRFFIGGIATQTLTFGTPDEVRRMVFDLVDRAGPYPGFAMASGGGLHDSVPLQNLEAYLDARVEVGATPPDWRTCCRV